MKNVTLKEMLENLVKCILEKRPFPTYWYKAEYEEGKSRYFEIVEVDLLRGRFKTSNDDFSEYDWEIEKSNIYTIPEEN